MNFARFVWKILVGIKDGLALLFLLLFFVAIYAVLTVRPGAGGAYMRGGALYVPIEGPVVEEKTRISPLQMLLSGEAPAKQIRLRDLVRGIEEAAKDDRIKAVVLDLDRFGGARQVALERVGAAMDKVRAAKKPVLVRATLYRDGAYLLAAHASEVWVDGLGGVAVSGPGGSRLYYKGLLDRLKINAHVFRVGTFKDAVEPYFRDSASPESHAAEGALLATLWADWQADVAKARPRAQIAMVTRDPVGWLTASNGDAAQASLKAGLVDRIGDREAFGNRVAQIVGAPEDAATRHHPGAFRRTGLGAYLADRAPSKKGKGIAVVTVANEIVDGKQGPGVAGGDRIARLIDTATADEDTPALVLRVDSPGGSVMASERIRAALVRFRATHRPIVVSMGSVAASGGYWVSTVATRVFAEPATITGSIGVFGVIPTFENALANWGVHADSFRTGPLSGQPDVFGGLTPESEAVVQGEIGNIYTHFLGLVAQARHKTPQEVDKIAQGRVWDGGTARQLGLVDEFGGEEEALAYAAKAAKLSADGWHAEFLGDRTSPLEALVEQLVSGGGESGTPKAFDATSAAAAGAQASAQRMAGDLSYLLSGAGAQAYCLECASLDGPGGGAMRPPQAEAGGLRLLGWLGAIGRLVR